MGGLDITWRNTYQAIAKPPTSLSSVATWLIARTAILLLDHQMAALFGCVWTISRHRLSGAGSRLIAGWADEPDSLLSVEYHGWLSVALPGSGHANSVALLRLFLPISLIRFSTWTLLLMGCGGSDEYENKGALFFC